MWWKYVLMYENGKMRPVEPTLRREEGVNLAKIYCKPICKCHNVAPV
jgi:hypothetical protein